MKKILLPLIALPFLLAACNDAPSDKTNQISPASQVSEQDKIKNLFEDAKKLNSFSTGSMMSANQAYVIFDPQCPHCTKLWNNTKGIQGVNFNWIPVGILNAKSTSQGAVIIASSEPAKLMGLHEELMNNNMGGIEVNTVPEDGKQKIKSNTEIFSKYKLQSVPTIIYQNIKTKQYGLIEGSVPREYVEEKLGLK